MPIVLAATGFVAAAAANTTPVIDGDGVVPLAAGPLLFGTVDCGASSSRTALVALRRDGSLVGFADGSLVTLRVAGWDPLQLQASFGDSDGNARIRLPHDWTSRPEGTLSEAVELAVRLTPNASGARSGWIAVEAEGAGVFFGGTPVVRSALLDVSWTAAGGCPRIPLDVVTAADAFEERTLLPSSSTAWEIRGDTAAATTETLPGGLAEPNTCGPGGGDCGRGFEATLWTEVALAPLDEGYMDLELCGPVGTFLEIYRLSLRPTGSSIEPEAEVAFPGGCSTWRWQSPDPLATHVFQVGRVPGAAAAAFTIRWQDASHDPDTEIVLAPGDLTGSTTAEFAFASTDADARYRCSLDSGAYGDCDNPLLLTGLAEGSHELRVAATIADGSYDGATDRHPAVHRWEVDLTPPETTILTAPPPKTKSATASFTFASSEPFVIDGLDLTSYQCSLDGMPFPCGFGGAVTVFGLRPGFHELGVRATDRAGNVDTTPATHRWLVQGARPA